MKAEQSEKSPERIEAEQVARSLDAVVRRLRQDFKEASDLQPTTEKNSTGWWWCEGRKVTAEISLRTIGYEP